MELKLIRKYFPNGTNGDILLEGEKVCSTIELPWKDNHSQISCIPEGRYELRKRWTQRFGMHFMIKDVPARSDVLIHPANDALKELKGCIAPVSFFTGQGKGSQSRVALTKLVDKLYPELSNGTKVFLVIESRQE